MGECLSKAMQLKVIFPFPQHLLPVSACLLGMNTKYSGSNNLCASLFLLMEADYFTPLPFCPEQLGGLPTPREAAEIISNTASVLIQTKSGVNVTDAFLRGAKESLQFLRMYSGIQKVLLKDGSPSCGTGEVYDGTFCKKRISGNGLAVQMLLDEGYICLNSKILEEPLRCGYYLGIAEAYSPFIFAEEKARTMGMFFVS